MTLLLVVKTLVFPEPGPAKICRDDLGSCNTAYQMVQINKLYIYIIKLIFTFNLSGI